MAPLVASDVTAGMQIYDEKWHFKMKVAHHFYSRRGGARLSAPSRKQSDNITVKGKENSFACTSHFRKILAKFCILDSGV
jgi:hypothetical protein